MRIKLFWHSYDYFPYEKELAEREIQSLFSDIDDFEERDEYITFSTSDNGEAPSKIDRLTYFREGRADGRNPYIPVQAKLEATSQNGGLEMSVDNELRCPEITRQQTRYSAHGIHEYKGKFNPQIVRALGNILGLETGDWLLDPFCGSGTTLLEAGHIGWNAVGIEINPLAVAVSNAKVQSLHLPTDELKDASEDLISSLNSTFSGLNFEPAFSESEIAALVRDGWEDDINGYDYLKDWFAESVLIQLWAIQEEIRRLESQKLQLIHEVILSNILRDVSQQDSGDLRTRREDSPPENVDVISRYATELREHVQNVSEAKNIFPSTDTFQRALNLDTRSFSNSIAEELDYEEKDTVEFDAAITSPPYATALPYVDTHRLSLIFFGMIQPSDLRDTERSLIGTRNIKKSSRDALYAEIEENTAGLPSQCISLCRELKAAVDPEDDGFRRQNKPALVYRYLRDMKESLKETKGVLKSGVPFAMIVGPNQTKLGGCEFTIDNPSLLEELGEQVGYSIDQNLELDTHQRFGMHNSSHSINAENLLVLQK